MPDGDGVIEPINRLAPQFGLVVATRDWHPANHGSFAANGGRWPVHCVQDSPGAELHPDLDRSQIDLVLDKGQAPELEGYSAFEHTDLGRVLSEHHVKTVHVAGLALDYCVTATALDARRSGFPVVLHTSATRAVDASPGDGERALRELRAAGVTIAD